MAQPPKIKRQSRIEQQLGQLPAAPPPATAPTEVPDIVERYTKLVGKIIHSFETQPNFGSKETNAIASLGRSVAMLQMMDTAKSSLGPGEKPLEQMTTSDLRERLGLKAPESTDVDYTEVPESDDE